MRPSDLEVGFLLGVLVGEGSFGGDGRQPSITVRMHTRHEALFRRLCDIVPGGRLYGPYEHSGRRYFQWIVRGPALRRLTTLLDEHLTPSLDAHAAARYERMKRTYARARTGGEPAERPSLPVQVRPARRGDASRMADLTSALGYASTTDDLVVRLERIEGTDAAATLVACDEEGVVVGYVGVRSEPLYEDDAPGARIVALVVDGEHRRVGVGERLVRAAEEWAATRGCRSITLTSANHRSGAHAFYRSLGYAAAGVRFARDLAP